LKIKVEKFNNPKSHNGMDQNERELLEQTLHYAKENNRMLKSMRSSARWGRFIRLIYWTVIIGVAIWLYYFLQPFLNEVLELYQGVVDVKSKFLPSGQ